MKLRIFRESYHDFFNFFEKKIPRKLPRSFDNKKLQKKKKKSKITILEISWYFSVNLMKWFFVHYRLVTWRRGWDRCEGRQWGQTLRQQSKQNTFFSLLRRLPWIPQLEKKVSAISPSSHAGFFANIIIISSSSWPSLIILDLSDKTQMEKEVEETEILTVSFGPSVFLVWRVYEEEWVWMFI